MNKPSPQSRRPYPLWRRLIKIVLWTVLGIVLAVTATLITVVATLSPERLTPLVTAVANRVLDAHVDIGRVELGLKASFPFLRLDVDSLTVLSPKMKALRAGRDDLPAQADTIVSIRHFTGGISLAALAKGDISLSDVSISAPRVNIVVVDDNINNFNIFPPDSTSTDADNETTDSQDISLPRISVDRFRVETPGRFSYIDIANGTEAVVTLRRAGIGGDNAPAYRFELSGNLLTPLLGQFNLADFPFSLDGTVDWDSQHPYSLRLDGFDVGLAFIKGRFSADFNFENDLIINSFETNVEPVEISSLLATVPDSMRSAWNLDRIHTDGSIALSLRLDSAYNTALARLPYATADITIGDCKAGYGRALFKNAAIDLSVILRGDDLGRASARLRRLNIAGPATDLTLSGTVDGFGEDPLIDGCLKGYSDIARLPSIVSDMLQGYISGKLDFDIDFVGRPSMLTANRFHNLKITGDIDGRDLYWLDNDTSTMAAISRLCLKFGSNQRFNNGMQTVDSLLTAVLRVDSADVLSGDISIAVGGITLGAGAANLSSIGDTTVVIPIGGGLKVNNFNLLSISDSIVFKARDVNGRVAMRRFNSQARVPQFIFNLGVRRIAAGDPSTRFMMSRAQVDFEAHKLPRRQMSEAMKHTVDSIRQVHPDLPPDSVYRLAFARHRRNRRHEPRVHPELTKAETEIIDWGTSKPLRRLLLGWSLDGSVKARRAGLFSAYFPIRNRIRNLDIRFNNDSIIIDSLSYKAGHSDFLVKGIISNMRRSLTSRGFSSPLKVNFDILSDTVDVNELTYTSMLGSSYAVRRSRGESAFGADYDGSDEALDRRVTATAAASDDSIQPILVPVNIDARIDISSRNVLYSDLDLKDMTGEILAYDGALNLHNLKATSDAGSVGLSALYAAPSADDIKFGFGLTVEKFNIERFERLIPAIDSIVPLLKDVAGIIDADVAATVDLTPRLDFKLPTLDAAVRITGDSLTIIDPETFKTMAKWLMFKDKQRNLIKHMSVSFLVEDNMLRVYPFIFDIDRYRLGVRGYNDLDFNFDYHVAVLKSPLPFKFGINIKGSPDKYKIRVGGAKFKADEAVDRPVVVDSARVNLIGQIEDIFRRGVSRSRFAGLNIGDRPSAATIDLATDTLSRADSLSLMREGLIPPDLTKDNIAY